MKPVTWFGLFISASLSHAFALDWSQKEISRDVANGTKEVRVSFAFANRADVKVNILDIETSCGCTQARVPTNTIAANSAGAVAVVLTVGERTGVQEKTIRVWTSESPEPVTLRLRVNIGATPAEMNNQARD